MDFSVCAQCGIEIEDQGIHFRGRNFCCDECCEEFEVALATSNEPGDEDLSADSLDDLDDDDLGYRNGDEDEEEFDDEFEIKPEDF